MTDQETFLQYLPEVLRGSAQAVPPGEEPFIQRFLHIFEQMFGSIEKKVDNIPLLFDPWQVEARFLPWLASWVALPLSEAWGERTRRALIRRIVSIYQKRGLAEGLQTFLRIYIGPSVEVSEDFATPHIFQVTVNFPAFDARGKALRVREIRKVIDTEKPAHTHYQLAVTSPTMQIGVHSTIGVDTILGTVS